MAINTKTPPLQPRRRPSTFDPRLAKIYGAVIRARRIELGHAQDEMSLLAGVDRSYYGKLERGERQPTLELMLRLSRALQLPAWELLRRVEEKLAAN